LLPAEPALPKFAAPVSKGVTDAVIEHRIQPVYPRQALAIRLEGEVVLLATVSEDGKVEKVKVLSGNGILAQAGIDAVRQWRYRPFLLDGKPIRMQTQVTLKFKAP
jgi:protein TonB